MVGLVRYKPQKKEDYINSPQYLNLVQTTTLEEWIFPSDHETIYSLSGRTAEEKRRNALLLS